MVSSSRILKYVISAGVFGLLVSVVTGIMENAPQASIIGAKYYGYQIVWRVTMTLQPDQLNFNNLIVDVIVWIVLSFIALIVVFNMSRYLKAKD